MPRASPCKHRAVGALIAESAGPPFRSWPNSILPERRLRIGYVSGDFLVHPIALFLQVLHPNHRRENVETFCYSNYAHSNPTSDSLRAKCQHWCDIHDMSDEQFAERIRRDEIDVLVDLWDIPSAIACMFLLVTRCPSK